MFIPSQRAIMTALIVVIAIETCALAYMGYLLYKLTTAPPPVPPEYELLRQEVERLRAYVESLQEILPKYPVQITFEHNNTQFIYYGDIITYIASLITISGVAEIPYRPIDITIQMAVDYVKSRPDLIFDIDWSRVYRIKNITSQTLDIIQAPWTAFPVRIENSQPGDWIALEIYIVFQGTSITESETGPIETVVSIQAATAYLIIRIM